MEKEPEKDEPNTSSSSMFNLFGVSTADTIQQTSAPNWLCNTSFTTNLSVIKDAVSALRKDHQTLTESDQEEEEEEPHNSNVKPSTSYQLIEEEEEETKASDSDSGSGSKKSSKTRVKRRRNKKKSSNDDVRVTHSKHTKDYYFDSHGDADNLVYGSLYRMNVPRYRPFNPAKLLSAHGIYLSNKKKSSIFDRDGDIDGLDVKLKSNGRYWSAKNGALEFHKNFKRLRFHAPRHPVVVDSDDFIPFSDTEVVSKEAASSFVEESWEDELMRKTREFNVLTRERPYDEKLWLDFAEFQDKVASMQPQKGVRLQLLEKKVSILEKAVELNLDNEELLLALLKAYQNRDSTDVLIGRWEKVLLTHYGSAKLWREYLRIFQGEFSRFKVSEMRKMYAHAIQALSSACNKQLRQVHQNTKPSSKDLDTVELELGLVNVFLSLCRFEWQAGHQELATALFQAEIEFSLFCPSLLLNEHSKLRLFEHFWNGNGPRIGEEGATGWSLWLEKEEENRQRIMKEETSLDDERGGWTGWSEPKSTHMETDETPITLSSNNNVAEGLLEESEDEEIMQEDDTELLLKELGIDVDAGPSSEVKDTSTWIRWSEEESLRDCSQWMPVHGTTDDMNSLSIETPDREADEQILRVILFEDVSEFLFSLSSEEARLSLLSQFIEFFGGDMSQWICTNSLSWTDKILSLDVLPDSMLKHLTLICNDPVFLLGNTVDTSKRSDIMKFLRNAILLCLTAFPRNHKLEQAALVAEELSATRTDSSTPCRSLAKSLLKSDRQDVLLCGVYAQREAASGNIAHARRIFDMALSLIEALPPHLQSNAPLLYFWYAEVELASVCGDTQESFSRALHILSCLGSGAKYSPFETKPSSLQMLRAHQGFKERMKTVQSTWLHGVVNDQSTALVCSAALFEELTTGFDAGVKVLDEAFKMVLPERRRHSYQLEILFNYYTRMLLKHHKQSSLSKLWESISQGLQIYPCSPELFKALVEIGNLYKTPNNLRLMFDEYGHRKPSVVVWIFALSFEMSKGGSQHRIHALFERALANDSLCKSVILWRMYVAYEIDVAHNPSAARRVFFRAIHACPWSKKLWLDGFLKLNSILSAKELSDLQEVMRDKELNLKTDIYEILLQDELK
ncbi:uncharacterized protein LOC126668990 isoform X2 [Mercurialis annua]|uniref:uncharacterized protein LOC126668990 isoform X2 n=1 Tax=Mercurialis annua TaxID=3986 RepID=UPI0021600F73|nr:uncharacterized protein LOC126668990 isoform X2 [Mercurialis annua]